MIPLGHRRRGSSTEPRCAQTSQSSRCLNGSRLPGCSLDLLVEVIEPIGIQPLGSQRLVQLVQRNDAVCLDLVPREASELLAQTPLPASGLPTSAAPNQRKARPAERCSLAQGARGDRDLAHANGGGVRDPRLHRNRREPYELGVTTAEVVEAAFRGDQHVGRVDAGRRGRRPLH